jgi:hypothetical protein
MLAPAVRVQRDIERNVGRGIAAEDGPGVFVGDLGRERARPAVLILIVHPAVVEAFAAVDLVAALQVRDRAAALPWRERLRRQHDPPFRLVVAIGHGAPPRYCTNIWGIHLAPVKLESLYGYPYISPKSWRTLPH